MFCTQSRSLTFGPRCIFCRGSGNGGSSVSTMILNVHTSLKKFSTSFTPSCSGSSPFFVRGAYSSRTTRPPNILTISPETGLIYGMSSMYRERLELSRWVSARRRSLETTRGKVPVLRSSGVFCKTAADGEGPRDETGNRPELLGEIEEELAWEGEDDLGEQWDELDDTDLERLGIKLMDLDKDEDIREQLQRPWGAVSVENEQRDYEIDVTVLQATLREAMEVLGCQAWDVGVSLTTDQEVLRLNRQYRGVEAPTDILSFPMMDMSNHPGVLPEVRHPAEMDLGDMFVSLAYVDRQMARDREEMEAILGREDKIEFPEGGTEWWDRNRGVSGAMSKSFDLQERTSVLLIHGLIHLLGYDHENPEDYENMVQAEERVLAAVYGKTKTQATTGANT